MFTEQDKKNIREFASEPKKEDMLANGRFGIGFGTCYSHSDLPMIFCNRELMMFDPSGLVFTGCNGKKFTLSQLEQFPGTLEPFGSAVHLPDVKQTFIRLPLRTSDHAQVSAKYLFLHNFCFTQ